MGRLRLGSPGRRSPSPRALGFALLLPDRAEARCAFKESRLLAVTHFWLSARKIASAWRTEKKPNNFSFVWGYFPLTPPLLLSFQDLNANGGLKPVDTFGFRSPVRPPSTKTFSPSPFLRVFFFLFKKWTRGWGGSSRSPPFAAPSLKGRERKGRASKR